MHRCADKYRLTNNIGAPILRYMNIPFTIAGLKQAGLTQSQIGEAIGCSQSTVSDMAAGKTGAINPSYKTVTGLLGLAEKRGVPIEPPARHRSPRKVSAGPP